ncbi:MAG TPA: hypothetical protein VJU59_43930 [Paraburkholderia sp.]|uniref:hypothetical protein n=1 Tax=Paraburkholderia sp. TaxID=1926495 RepID=UPI002B4929FC|nr:hypothetical protein [Paraburkholderia sp.]HKR46542.1 hypothetical protein [Paraburkholderia sp.]
MFALERQLCGDGIQLTPVSSWPGVLGRHVTRTTAPNHQKLPLARQSSEGPNWVNYDYDLLDPNHGEFKTGDSASIKMLVGIIQSRYGNPAEARIFKMALYSL